jgi:ABC-type multidrug transport system permease subunit
MHKLIATDQNRVAIAIVLALAFILVAVAAAFVGTIFYYGHTSAHETQPGMAAVSFSLAAAVLATPISFLVYKLSLGSMRRLAKDKPAGRSA